MTSGDGGLKSEINVTPLVDVMLVVLIIFMLVTPMFQKGVGVELPRAGNVRDIPENDRNATIVTLTGSGKLFIGGRSTDPATLEGTLRRRYAADPSRELHIKADRDVRYGEVRKIVEAARRAGLPGAALVAERLGRPGSAAPAPEAGSLRP